MDKMKIVWICSLSNPKIREYIKLKTSKLESVMLRFIGRATGSGTDSAIWNTNAIIEMENNNEVELHIVSPVRNLSSQRQDFEIDGIYYHFIKDENSPLYRKVKRYIFTKHTETFKKNRFNICKVINEIRPDLVHIIGAENPQYSLALLDIPREMPTLLQLQALLATIVEKTEGEQQKDYKYKAEIEKQLINRADYIGTGVPSFINYIRNEIKPDALIVNTNLAMAQVIDISVQEKEYDFVHFASMLGPSKATDIAIEAFGLAYKECPSITLDIIGGITPEFQNEINTRIAELGIGNAIKFEGKLATHDDVIKQIRKARFALLPLKVSIVPNTVHEAMANGLPVVTTVTPGTPTLNEKRKSVLISPVDDEIDISKKMIVLLKNEDLANELRSNAAETEKERENNTDIIKHWIEVYKAIIKQKEQGVSVPQEFLN